jgi:hypothetical protein
MMETIMTTYSARAAELEARWYVIDAQNIVLGRLASQVAQILRGKHKPTFTPNQNCGDFWTASKSTRVPHILIRLSSHSLGKHRRLKHSAISCV